MKASKRFAIVLFAAGVVLAGVPAGTQAVYAKGISSAAQAEQKALAKVKNATVTDVDTDHEDGTLVYDVELVKGNKKYEVTYRASDAKILAYDWEKIVVEPEADKPLLSQDKCRKKAQAKVKGGTVLSIVQKNDDGVAIFKVKMKAGNKNYTLKYHARTGALIEYGWELAASSASDVGGGISKAKAKQIALAQVPGAAVVKVELDTDDGIRVYEVELIKGQYEYEFKISADTGAILEQDRDLID